MPYNRGKNPGRHDYRGDTFKHGRPLIPTDTVGLDIVCEDVLKSKRRHDKQERREQQQTNKPIFEPTNRDGLKPKSE